VPPTTTTCMIRHCIVFGAVLGGVAVAAGAFGAHGLAATLAATGQTANWDTAFRYGLVHALALVATGLVAGLPTAILGRRWLAAAAWCFAVGTLVFSGCLAALALTGVRVLGAIVPIGGTLLIVGWGLLALGGWQATADRRS
jgi:uncharacterized membrane protein YgdD (TMEM256/DUF423 family)